MVGGRPAAATWGSESRTKMTAIDCAQVNSLRRESLSLQAGGRTGWRLPVLRASAATQLLREERKRASFLSTYT